MGLKDLFGSSGFSSAVSTAGNIVSTAMTNAANERMQQRANEYNHKLWEENNAYNTPAEQMKRLREAGINPALAYAQGGVDNTSDAPAQSADPIAKQAARVQFDFTNSQTKLAEAQAELARAQAQSTQHAMQRDDEVQPHQIKLLQQQIEDYRHQWEALSYENQLKHAQTLHIGFEEMMSEKNYQLALKDLNSMIEHRRAQDELSHEEARVARANADFLVKTMVARIMGLNLQNEKIRSEIGLNNANIKVAQRSASLLGLDIIERAPHAEMSRRSASNLNGENGWFREYMAIGVEGLGYVIGQLGSGIFGRMFGK